MVEISALQAQNPWWRGVNAIEDDFKIRDFKEAKIKWHPRIAAFLDLSKDGGYILRGPRQVGKSTLMKLMIHKELGQKSELTPAIPIQGCKPKDIFYFQCDLISSAVELHDLIDLYLTSVASPTGRKLIFLDEITSVPEWEKAYKDIFDRTGCRDLTFILTGSSALDLKRSADLLPGRKLEVKLLLPMKFAEYVELRDPELYKIVKDSGLHQRNGRFNAFERLMSKDAAKVVNPLFVFLRDFDKLFDEYLITGGVMSAVNEHVVNREIKPDTYDNYVKYLIGDITKQKRDEISAKKILAVLLQSPVSPVSWPGIQKKAGISRHETVEEHVDLLETLFLFKAYLAFDLARNGAKLRSERKIQIGNPFFFHALRGFFLNPVGDYYHTSIDYLGDKENKSVLVESVVGDHLTRLAFGFSKSDLFKPADYVFYVKTKSGREIDFLVRLPTGMVPVEVKYQNSIKDSDFNELKNFERGFLVTKDKFLSNDKFVAIPASIFLLFV